ncbi:MAG: rubredoxin [Rhodoferax sp.]|nr:MAG: rubredoxin [Rhodoferax sp.]
MSHLLWESERIVSTNNCTTPQESRQFFCKDCGHIYDETLGANSTGIPAGTLWEMIPPTWCCPPCGASKSAFGPVDF